MLKGYPAPAGAVPVDSKKPALGGRETVMGNEEYMDDEELCALQMRHYRRARRLSLISFALSMFSLHAAGYGF
ncbi:hypothetical protein [Paracoccus sp. (in: a-proteobacteria)]|uniref:hypothetical protein n=1 Tax=Paracoccus sp. TaxID=267 RepID=UPI0028AD5FD4|nr:hypothetical protein [Paracoccus sp. (in: a-proteobacteria)]